MVIRHFQIEDIIAENYPGLIFQRKNHSSYVYRENQNMVSKFAIDKKLFYKIKKPHPN